MDDIVITGKNRQGNLVYKRIQEVNKAGFIEKFSKYDFFSQIGSLGYLADKMTCKRRTR